MTINLEEIEIGKIKEYADNAKIHTPEQIEAIRDSMITFGYRDPIAIDENDEIIYGHGRLLALRQIYSDATKKIKVLRLIGLSKEEKIAFRIAHNKLNLDTGFDEKILGLEFNILEDTDLLTSTGFSLQEITKIWDKKMSTTEILEQDKTTVIQHTCPECGHTWEEEFKKSRKKE